jgi:hypothetical protein
VTAQLAPSSPPRPGQRQIDPRGHRFGGALSAVLLAVAFLAAVPWLVAAVSLALWLSALFGTRYSILGRPWPFIRRTLQLGPPAALEGEYPPRFAQAFGAVVLTVSVLLFAAGASVAAWLLVGAVAALQILLAATGYCLGCRLYFLRWYAPVLFDRLAALTTRNAAN